MAVAWHEWVDAVTAGIVGVGDEELFRAAALIKKSNLVITAGNGGSASLASHAAQAIAKPSYKAGGGKAAVCLTDMVPTLTAHANDAGWATALVETARPLLDSANATLLLISSSGTSANLVNLANLAAQRGRPIVAFTGFGGGQLRTMATISLHVNSEDYEVIEPCHDALVHRMQYHLRTLSV